MQFLALGAVGLLLARKWHASRWLSAALIAWYLWSIILEWSSELSLALARYAAQSGAGLFVIGCGLVAVLLPFLSSPPTQWRIGRLRPRRITRAYGLVAFVRAGPHAHTEEMTQP